MNHLDKIERIVCISLLSAIVLLVFTAAVMRTVDVLWLSWPSPTSSRLRERRLNILGCPYTC